MSGEPVRSLFVTLRRGLAGKPWFHQRVIKALGLKGRHHMVEKPNNESIRGMMAKVSHLIIVETDRMFYLRRMREYYQLLPRTPFIVHHGPAVESHLQLSQQLAKEQELQEQQQQATMAAVNLLTSSATSSNLSRSAAFASASQQDFPILRPLQSVMVIPHLVEHMSRLPEGAQTTWKPSPGGTPLSERIAALMATRGAAVHKGGLYSLRVRQLNQEIQALKTQQVDKENEERATVLSIRHAPGAEPIHVRSAGRGSRRGMLAEARAGAAAKVEQRKLQHQQRLTVAQDAGRALAQAAS